MCALGGFSPQYVPLTCHPFPLSAVRLSIAVTLLLTYSPLVYFLHTERSFSPSVISPFSLAHQFPVITYSLIIFIGGSYSRQDRCLIYTAGAWQQLMDISPRTPPTNTYRGRLTRP